MKNLLTLHEAIAVVLLGKPGRMANIKLVAAEINKRKLYVRADGQALPPYQVMMRCKLSNGKYKHLFNFINPETIQLKNYDKN